MLPPRQSPSHRPSGAPDTGSRTPPRRRPWCSVLAVLALGAVAAGAYGLYRGAVTIPERFNPWAPLDVAAPPNFLTPYKLSRARNDPARCLQALSHTDMAYDLLPDRVTGPGCGFDNAVRLREAGVRLAPPVSLSCPMALSFFMWERHALQPAAQRHFGQRVAAVAHLGSYACRNVNRGDGATPESLAGLRSRHATANALDIAGFTLENGEPITMLKDWRRTGKPADAKADLLDDVHEGACRYFTGVLGPDYNAVHRDHFHLETGGYAMCR